jgi:hypothetical protein
MPMKKRPTKKIIPYKVGDKVVWKSYTHVVAKVLDTAKVRSKRTRIDKDPPLMQKYFLRVYYESGLHVDSWVRHKYLKKIDEKEFKAFLKKHPAPKAR